MKLSGRVHVYVFFDLYLGTFGYRFDAEDYDANLLTQLRTMAYAHGGGDHFAAWRGKTDQDQIRMLPAGSYHRVLFVSRWIDKITISGKQLFI